MLKCSQDLQNREKDLLIESEEEYFELAKYNTAVAEQIFCQDRYQVALSMENFRNRKIDGEEFCGRIDRLCRKLINACEKLKFELGSAMVKDFQPDVRSKKLSGLDCKCEHFADDSQNSIKNGFLNFKKAFNEE